MIKIGMCDDDLNAVKLTARFLEAEIIEQNLDAEITLVTNNQKEIFNAIYNYELDVLFLDIDFKDKGKNGLEFEKDLRSINKNFYLVFLSAHFKYIQLSLTNKVFDFLVKPINRDTIEDLVSRLKDEFDKNNLIFLHLNKWSSIRTDKILYIEKEESRCKVVTPSKVLYTTKTLHKLMEDLPSNFIRCHKSYIANTDRIIGVDKKQNMIYFSHGMSCPMTSTLSLEGSVVHA